MPRTLTDDLGHAVELPGVVARVVSLVPSLTEALAATCPERLVGATDWCTHPADLDARGVARVRGTKNPDLSAVAALRPDLVVANKEENRELDVRRMRERGIPVWVTDIETVPPAVASMRRLLREVLEVAQDPRWLVEAEEAWCGPVPPVTGARGRAGLARPVDGGGSADLHRRPARPGRLRGVDGGGRRGATRRSTSTALDDPAAADLVLLPDEPYVFTAGDGPEAFRACPTRLVSGRLLTWYGPALVDARISLDRS